MTRTCALVSAGVLFAATALAQSDIIIKQHAKDIRDQNNARQGATPPSAPAQPARPSVTAASSAPTPVQQAMAKVRADLAAIKPNSVVTPEQKQELAKDLLAAAQGAKKPSSATVATLVDELSAALVQKPMSDASRNRLLTDVAAALNPASIQPAQMQAIYADAQAVFRGSGLPQADAEKLAQTLKAVAAETRP
jgi:hypothetical protein